MTEPNWYHAAFSNGHIIKVNTGRRTYTHAWHARGQHKLTKEPWAFHGFSGSSAKAALMMRSMINFAPAECITFAEVIAVEWTWPPVGAGNAVRTGEALP